MSDVFVIGLAVAGWLASTWLAYRWGLHSQKLQREDQAKSAVNDRRRQFLAFMRSWRIEIGQTHLVPGGFTLEPSSFSDVVSSFVAQAELIREDFPAEMRKEFDALVSLVTRFTGGELNVRGGHERIQKSFDDLIAFVDGSKGH